MPAQERVAVGFPGQGGDWLAALRTLDAHPDHALVRQLRAALGDRIVPDAQIDVRVSQPTVFVAGLVAADAASMRPGADGVVAAIGHSLGELTAAAFAGAIDRDAALALAIRRGELSHAAQARRPGSMLLLTGIEEPEVEWLRRRAEHAAGSPLDLAVRNSATQFVLAGVDAVVDACLDLAAADEVRARRLPIGGAFHTSLMADVADEFVSEAASIAWSEPALPLILSTCPEQQVDAASLPGQLARAFVLPVRWDDAIDRAEALGVTGIVDAGPGDTLVRLGRGDDRIPVRVIEG